MSMSVISAFELEWAQELLRRSRQGEWNRVPTASMEELLGRPKHPVLVKNTTLLEYLDPVQDRVSRTFTDEKDLLSVFTGVKFQDAAFASLDEGRGGGDKEGESSPTAKVGCSTRGIKNKHR